MTVKELIKLLEKLDQDAVVLCSSDSEGNTISPLLDYTTVQAIKDLYDVYEVEDKDKSGVVLYPSL